MCYFSIVVPIYNAEKYINRCMDSILEQKYKDYEVLLLDDESSDNSVMACMKYSNEYSNIHTYRLTHCGASQARNCGIEWAKGKYIVFVDADDYLQDEMLLKLYEDTVIQESDVCYMGRHYVESGNQKHLSCIIKQERLLDGQSVSPETFFEKIVQSKSGIPGSMWLIAVKRQFLLEKNIEINPKYVWSEDSDFSYNIMMNAEKISVCDYPGYVWCIGNAGSVSKNINSKKIISRLEVYKNWYYYFNSNLSDNVIKEYVCKYMLRNYSSCLINYSFLKGKNERLKVKEVFEKDNLWKVCQDKSYDKFYKYGLEIGRLNYRLNIYWRKVVGLINNN